MIATGGECRERPCRAPGLKKISAVPEYDKALRNADAAKAYPTAGRVRIEYGLSTDRCGTGCGPEGALGEDLREKGPVEKWQGGCGGSGLESADDV